MPYYIYRLIGYSKVNKYIYHYIGSTPYPQKRIRQHNNFISGGAKYTHSKLSILKTNSHVAINNNNSFDLKWNYQFIIMTFFNKQSALSLEWHLKYPFSVTYNNSKKLKSRYNVKLNDEYFNYRYPSLNHDINIMLKQIDITISYFFNNIFDTKNNTSESSKQIIIFFDATHEKNIIYKPVHFTINYLNYLNYSIYNNNVMSYFDDLK